MSHKAENDSTKAAIIKAMDQIPDNCVFISVTDDGKTQILFNGKSKYTMVSLTVIAQKYMLDNCLGARFPSPPKSLKLV